MNSLVSLTQRAWLDTECYRYRPIDTRRMVSHLSTRIPQQDAKETRFCPSFPAPEFRLGVGIPYAAARADGDRYGGRRTRWGKG